jgi:hypothetical protein
MVLKLRKRHPLVVGGEAVGEARRPVLPDEVESF